MAARRGRSQSISLSPLSEASNQTEGSSTRDDSSTSTPTSAPSVQPALARRRRFLGWTDRFRTASNANSSSRMTENSAFNPEADEFVPSTTMPPKRKASTLAKRNSATNSRNHHPVIPAKEIMGDDCLARNPDIDSLDDSFEDVILDQGQDDSNANVVNVGRSDRARLQEYLDAVRSPGIAEKMRSLAGSVACQSAILFARDDQTNDTDPNEDHGRIRYLPLCPILSGGRREPIGKNTRLTVLRDHRERIDQATQPQTIERTQWPQHGLPVELFDIITKFLSRDDIKSMRLVSKEFEQKVAANLFGSSVVGFNSEIYHMIDEDSKIVNRIPPLECRPNGKGKGRAMDNPVQHRAGHLQGLQWQNALDDADGKVYRGHGLRVFQGFGPHMRKFGMSFEVSEEQLNRPPIKKELNHVSSYHGSYDWPQEQYARFATLAGLERTADETFRMKSAFSNLSKVKDIALSVDNGLGWLNGPDKSVRARIFHRPSSVFGRSHTVPDAHASEAQAFWSAIESCHRASGSSQNKKEISLGRCVLSKPPTDIPGLESTPYADTNMWSSIAASRATPSINAFGNVAESQYGVLYTTFSHPDINTHALYDRSALVPAALRKEQKEWLMETDWAQRAFLECYMLAVIDNPLNFCNVKTMTLAKLSSGLLPTLSRGTFWDALPGVKEVTIHIKPDWRAVQRDSAGVAEMSQRRPSDAVELFYRVMLRDRLCLRPAITKLDIGWAAGGELAEGMFARNNHILPAPIAPLDQCTAAAVSSVLAFQYVEHLTLTNCWISPPLLELLVRNHADKKLKILSLDSVSLTAHPRFTTGGQATLHNQLMQALAGNAQGQAANGNINVQAQAAHIAHQQLTLAHMAQNMNQQQAMAPAAFLQQQAIQQHTLQQQALQQPGNVNVPGAFPPLGAAPAPAAALPPPIPPMNPPTNAPTAPTHWSDDQREGSWADVLNKISPGPIFTDYLPQPLPWEEQHPEREPTSLQTIELKSCGYVKLIHNTSFEQFVLEAGADHQLSHWFRSREAVLQPAMLATTDRHIGMIVQHITKREMNALRFAWNLVEGWTDAGKAEEVEYDGLLPGGTGRITGTITKPVTSS